MSELTAMSGIPLEFSHGAATGYGATRAEAASRDEGHNQTDATITDEERVRSSDDKTDLAMKAMDTRIRVQTAISLACGWTFACLGIGIIDKGYWWIATIFLMLLAALTVSLGGREHGKIQEHNLRVAPKLHAFTGKKPPQQDAPGLAGLITGILLVVSASVGFWLVCRHFYNGGLSHPDGSKDLAAVAIQLWLFGWLMFGAFYALLSANRILKRQRVPAGSQDFDTSVGPEIPQVRSPTYPTVFVFAGYWFSYWYLLGLIGFCAAHTVSFKQMNVTAEEERRLQLYIDWHGHFFPGKTIDAKVMAQKKARDEVSSKCAGTTLTFWIMYGGLFIPQVGPRLTGGRADTRDEHLGSLGAILLLSLIGDVVVWYIWRRELRELFTSRRRTRT